MNWRIAYILFLLLETEAFHPNIQKYIPDYPDDHLTPEKISAQLGIPIRTTSASYDFKSTPNRRTRFPFFQPSTYYPNTQYSRRNAESAEVDVFEIKPRPTFELTRRQTFRPTISDFLRTRSTTQSTHFVDNEEETTSRPRISKRTTVQIDSEVKAPRTRTTRRHTRTHQRSTTTRQTFLVDSEVSGEKSSSRRSTTEPTTQKSTTDSTTDATLKTTETHGKVHVGDTFIVDGEAGPQVPFFTQTQPPILTTTPEPFNPWALFTTFPPTYQSIFPPITTPPQTGYVDFAPNCLNNAVLCREGGSYEQFMRIYCRETCRLYDNTVPNETEENCKDIADNCEPLKSYCFAPTSPYYLLLRRNCQNTCKYCNSTSTSTNSAVPAVSTQSRPFIPPATLPPFVFPPLQPTPRIGPPPLQPQTNTPRFGPPPLEPQTNTPPRLTYGECRDVGQNCRLFLGECDQSSMASVLSQFCASSCGFCASCEDALGSQCDEFIRKGFCRSPHFRLAIKKRYCRRSCNLCEQTPNALPDFLAPIPNFG